MLRQLWLFLFFAGYHSHMQPSRTATQVVAAAQTPPVHVRRVSAEATF